MTTLSIELDSFACAATLVHEDALTGENMAKWNPKIHYVASSALLMTDGWVFTTPDKWPDLDEQNHSFFNGMLVRFEDALGACEPLNRNSHAKPGPLFHRIDYLASLFRAAADLTGADRTTQATALIVSVPSYAVAADKRNARPADVTSLGRNNVAVKAVLEGFASIDVCDRDLFADIERAGLRAGFSSVMVQPAAVALGKCWLQEIPEFSQRLKDKARTERPMACAVEFSDYGIGFVPLELTGDTLAPTGQCLFLRYDWAGALQRSAFSAMSVLASPLTDPQKRMIWQRFIADPLRTDEWSMESGALRLSIRNASLQPDWKAEVDALRTLLAPDTPVENWLVAALADSGRFVSFFLSGYGASDAALARAVELMIFGSPAEAKVDTTQFNFLGVLDHSHTSEAASPRLVGTRSARVNADVVPRGIASGIFDMRVRQAPKHGAGVYRSLTITPSSQQGNGNVGGITLELPELQRPTLCRSVAIAEGTATSGFRIGILEHGKKAEQTHHYEVAFELQSWEVSRRLEVEVRVDDTDRIEIGATVGGVSSPVVVQRISGQARQEADWECIGLGRYEAFTDDHHRTLTEKMSRQDGEAVVNYQLY